MESVTISKHGNADAGEYHAHVTGEKAIGRLTWVTRNGARVAEHTIVPPEIGGRGIGGMLVKALIDDAQVKGFRVVPQCSFVAAAFDKHPEWADLRA